MFDFKFFEVSLNLCEFSLDLNQSDYTFDFNLSDQFQVPLIQQNLVKVTIAIIVVCFFVSLLFLSPKIRELMQQFYNRFNSDNNNNNNRYIVSDISKEVSSNATAYYTCEYSTSSAQASSQPYKKFDEEVNSY